jgi:Uma2 family endonuclease
MPEVSRFLGIVIGMFQLSAARIADLIMTRDRWETLSADQRQGILPLSPDAAFEVRSKSNTPAELQQKMREYGANGVRIAVLIDRDTRRVEVYGPGRGPDVLLDPDRVSLEPELPGFVLDLGPILEA